MKRNTNPAVRHCVIETLEARSLLSVSVWSSGFAQPQFRSPQITNTAVAGYSPAQIYQGYGFNKIFFNGVAGDGTGQTIAIVDAYGDPNIGSDLTAFDAQFGLAPPPSFKVVKQQNRISTDSGWALETSLDVEWAHAIAPNANIVLFEASTASLSNLLSAVNAARNWAGVSVVSMSWGGGEFSSESAYDSYFTTPAGHIGVTFVASAGDTGAPPIWPSVSPNVIAVGGTTLNLDANGNFISETAWNGSGGGISLYESKPSYQSSVSFSLTQRTVPDVAYDANPSTGFPVYDSVAYNGQTGWFEVGGTSAGAPQWAALIAIANQGRALENKAALTSLQTLSLVYGMGPSSSAYSSSNFNDITSGSSTGTPVYSAGTGYDLVTGLGSPKAAGIVGGLL